MTIDLDPHIVAILAGAVIPILVGVATKLNSSTSTKATVALALSAAAGALTEIVTANGRFILADALTSFAIALGSTLAAYHGVWKPIGDSDLVPLQRLTARFGIGDGAAGS